MFVLSVSPIKSTIHSLRSVYKKPRYILPN